MPLLLRKEVAEESWLGIWQIEESAEWFRLQLILNESENQLIDSLKNHQRKLHWLSSRVLLRNLMGTNQFIHLENDLNGKPVIQNFQVQLSLSHSAGLSALLLSKKYKVGIDIEKIDPKVLRIQHKFVSEAEMQWLGEKERIEQLYVIWCVKEAMYKWYGEKKLDFRAHLFVEPFHYATSGEVNGRIAKGTFLESLVIQYEKVGDYMMAFVLK